MSPIDSFQCGEPGTDRFQRCVSPIAWPIIAEAGTMETRAILRLDLDAFYASIEQRDHPEYRGKPVIAEPPGVY